MKKTIFFGLLTVVILIFASCIPLDPSLFDDLTSIQDSFTGTYEIDFDYRNTKLVGKDSFFNWTFKFDLEPDPNNENKMLVTFYDYPDDYGVTDDVTWDFTPSGASEPSFTISEASNSIDFDFSVEYFDDTDENLYSIELNGAYTLDGTSSIFLSGSFPAGEGETILDGYFYIDTWAATKTSN